MRHFEEAGSSKPSLNIKKQPKTAFLGIKSCAKSPRSKISPNDPDYLFQGSIWDLHAKFQRCHISFFFWPLKRELFPTVSLDRVGAVLLFICEKDGWAKSGCWGGTFGCFSGLNEAPGMTGGWIALPGKGLVRTTWKGLTSDGFKGAFPPFCHEKYVCNLRF